MVFCGRPSKACQRCRDRRLKCDLKPSSCSSCLRAHVFCTGYRDPHMLRIRNESQTTHRKAIEKKLKSKPPRSVEQPLNLRARDSFFAHHVSGSSKTWNLLEAYYDSSSSPDHLTFSIDAVSLAYLSHSHQIGSDRILNSARQKYGRAMTLTRRALQSPDTVMKDTTLLTSLLLDLFEKITNTEPSRLDFWQGHITGAMSLVQLRGLERLTDPLTLRALVRLSTNLLISYVASDSPVPDGLIALRSHAEKYLNIQDPKWKLSGLMVKYANLRSLLLTGHFSAKERVDILLGVDGEFQRAVDEISSDIPLTWIYKKAFADFETDRIFQQRVDFYYDRHTTQTWNVLRLVRILLNEAIVEECQKASQDFRIVISAEVATDALQNIQKLAEDICASIPQYVEYHGGKEVLHLSQNTKYLNPPAQKLSSYSLIFPLYIAGRSTGSSDAVRKWSIQELRYMARRFGIHNAEQVADIIEDGGTRNPWSVYAMLGSYAFSA